VLDMSGSRGQRLAAALIAGAIAVGGMTTGADASKHSGKKQHAKQHHKKKHHKKKHHPKRPKPRPTPTPVAVGVAQSATVDAVAGGGFHLQFTATRAAGAAANAATGTFRGTLEAGGTEIGHFAGPVTCLSVVGNDIGLFYPIDESNPPGLEGANAGVFISVKVDGDGQATMAGFLPVPVDHADSCDPSMTPALLPATGTGTAAGG
jgi:hypothetical protein